MASFEGKVIAMTGAASGMGLATAQLLASRGAIISLADINEAAVKDATASLEHRNGQEHMYSVVDVQSSKGVDSWIETTVQKLGRLDGAVNMAGIIKHARPIAESTDEDWESTFAVNARGVYYCLRAQIKAMAPGGSIVSAASVFGQVGAPGNAAYCASKAAVIGLIIADGRQREPEHPHQLRVARFCENTSIRWREPRRRAAQSSANRAEAESRADRGSARHRVPAW
ncbi:hypothetical protein F4823DRAFT_598092 [Ustulina deusta]|nr:hypothetical protein F4823DRAFT_598092 [Ustulina deusta]